MKDRKLAARYARALLAALPDPTSAAKADEFLHALAAAMQESAALREALTNPAIARSARRAILGALIEGRDVPSRALSFLDVVFDNGRLAALPTIAVVFSEEREKAAGIVAATVTSAKPLDPDLRQRIAAALERLAGSKVSLTVDIDPSLVGGVVARIGSTIYDGSVRTQLNSLRQRMAEE